MNCFDEDEVCARESAKIINDKDLNSDMIFYGKLDQVQSKIPTFQKIEAKHKSMKYNDD